jgi:hypothetical protein
MKPLKLILLLGVTLTLCSFGPSLGVAPGISRASLLLFVVAAALGAYHLRARERKARVMAPVRIRRKEPVVVRRRPGQW